MAKQTDRELEEKRVKPFYKFLFLIVIPLLFAVMVALIVATAAGINVLDEAKSITGHIPFVSGLFQEDTSTKGTSINEQNSKQLQAELKDRDKQISQLQSKLGKQDQDLQKAKFDNDQLQQEISDLQASQKQNKRALKDIVTTYETMSPKKSALIISKMSDSEALQILTNVKPDILASIMESMDPAQAARFTELMTSGNGSN